MSDATVFGYGQQANPRSVSLNELAYLSFRQRLITLHYNPGEYLNAARIMSDLKMGRTPINQAIHRLATEGLLQIIPRKGVVVSPLSIDDALELIEVRLVNEMLCLRLASQKVTAGQITRLREINRLIARAKNARNGKEMILLDRDFHQLLAAIAANGRLSDILSVIHAQAQRFWATTLASEKHKCEVVDEHDAIIDALESGDAERAADAVRMHILSFKHALLSS